MFTSTLLRTQALLFTCLCTPIVSAEILFEENRGQTESKVQYFSRLSQGFVFFTADSMVLHRQGLAGELRFRFLGAHDGDWPPTSATGRTVSHLIGRDR